jgi:hypothetical protein
MRAVLVLLTLWATPALAQRGGCGLGNGLRPLDAVEQRLAQPLAGLTEGRAEAERSAAELREAARWLAGCGCRRLVAQTEEAAALAELAQSEASAAGVARRLDRARFSLRLARESAGREGCT